MNPVQLILTVTLVLVANAEGRGGDEPRPNAKRFDEQVRPLLAKHCLECHAGEKPKGDFNLDKLSSEFADKISRERWFAVMDRVKSGTMPPKTKPRLPEKDAKTLTDWIAAEADAAELARRTAQGRVPIRRLNRLEYQNTICDLLGIDVDLEEMLPLDSSGNGFDNASDAQHVSTFLLERYLEAADTALNLAIANGPQPPLVKKRYSIKESHQVKYTQESVYRPLTDDTVVCFSSSAWNAVGLTPFYPPDRGKYRFRISASAIQSSGKPVSYRVDAGPLLMATKNHFVGYFDAPAEKPAIIEFSDHLEARSTIRIHPYGLAGAQTVTKLGAEKYEGPGLAIQWVEVEGPLHDVWPPASHTRIFGNLSQGKAPTYNRPDRVEVVSKNPELDAERIIRDFAKRAFRRPVTDADIKPFLALVKAKLAEKHSFEQAVRVGLKAVMVSPQFLFLREEPGKLDDFALANRLSYFLWSTMPDEELLALAGRKQLGQPEVLRGQVERMLKSPKSATFTQNFVGQWLGLRDIDFTEPSVLLYPEFDHMLRVSMVRETELFFEEVLKNNLSLMNFVASDFTMLNGPLAKHYGIPGVDGWEFRKATLPKNSHRGGVLTMASVLKVTANGTNTSPVVRGAWVMDRILGTPPPRPPADVPAIEPDTRGATTIRQQLAKHRQIASCANCHAKIDPAGFALESFDVIGGWRENYRTTGLGEPVMIDGRRMHYLKGPKIDPSDVLPDGQKFRNIDELKELLLRDKDQIARSLTERLIAFATGAAPASTDRPEIDAIVRKIREKDYGFRTLVHEIVLSELFRNK
ncbi:MAG TPA: DUF1592 domain-containing protein [Gemmata sp.]|jgi:hypothetical protein|nr:DUF1592 domain-containing protein [Gemmata sp.]